MKIEDKKGIELKLKDITFGTCIYVDGNYYIVTSSSNQEMTNIKSDEILAVNLKTGRWVSFTPNLTPKIVKAKVIIE